MKSNFTKFAKRAALYVSVMSLSALMYNCSSDDDGPRTYDFEEEFENLGELPELVDEDPTFTEPDAGSVEQSTATLAVIADLGDGTASADTQASLDAVGAASADLSADATTAIANLDDAKIAEILDATSLTGAAAEVAAAFDAMPEAVKALLPSVTYSADFNRVMAATTKEGLGLLTKGDFVAQNTPEGPCYTAAQAAYNAAMQSPIANRDAQLAAVQTNYDRRLGEADARFNTREASVAGDYDTYKAEILATAKSILALANAATDATTTSNLRSLAYFYSVKASVALTEWETEVDALLITITGEEKASLLAVKEQRVASVNAAFDVIKEKADKKLNEAYNNCHNQGGGN